MEPLTVTPDLSSTMPRQQGLLLRGSRWYSNFKVPKPLQLAFGRTHVRETLETSDYREAVRKVAYERARWVSIFEDEARKLKAAAQEKPVTEKRLLTSLSQREAFEFAVRYLVLREREFQNWMDNEGRFLDRSAQTSVRDSLADDYEALACPDDNREVLDGSSELRCFLDSEGFQCAETSPAFQSLRPLVMAAHLEHLARSEDLVMGRSVLERDNRFRGIHAQSPATNAQKGKTLDDLIRAKERSNKDLSRSVKTVAAFKLPARLLREVLGKDKLLSSITREDMQRVFDVMREMPLNAVQRYQGMTIVEAIEAAKKASDTRKQHQNTLWAHYVQVASLFSFAVEEHMMSENPASTRYFRELFKKQRGKRRSQFTIEELNRLFKAPLYTGCADDGTGYAKPGPDHPRRGRFWVPLLALFHGMRCNEACQIHSEDVKTEGGIAYIAIREETETGGDSGKRLKTTQSIRDVPIHPEVLKMGFIEFVAKRKRDASSPLLFPELTAGHNGYFSDAFSKWFGRFVQSVFGEDCKATMHSFRHQFRDATRAARLLDESVGRLAGWEHGKQQARLQMHHYGRGPDYLRTLADDLAKVQYPGLILSHLYRARLRED